MGYAINLEKFPYKIAALYPDKASAEDALHTLQEQASEDIHCILLSSEMLDVDSSIKPD